MTGVIPRSTELQTAVCVSDPAAAAIVHDAAVDMGANPVHVSPIQLAKGSLTCRDFTTIIYDLAPWTDAVVPLVRALRHAKRTVPVLLYTPSTPTAATLLENCGEGDGIKVTVQSTRSNEICGVRENVAWLLAARDAELVCYLVELLITDLPRRPRDYIRATLACLIDREKGRLISVRSVSAVLTVPNRTIQRDFESAGLPSPKTVMDWLTLMFLSLAADTSRRAITTVAKDFGAASYQVRRLRKRLLHLSHRSVHAAQSFDLVFLTFAEACRVPSTIARDVIARAG